VNRWKTGVLALALLGAVAGCIPTQRQLRMEQDLEEMKRRLAQTERSVVALRGDRSDKTSEGLETLSRQQADLQAGLDTLRVEFQSVNGRLEDMTKAGTRIRDDLSLVQDDLSLKVTAMEDRLEKLEAAAAAQPVSSQAAAAPAETPESLYEGALERIQKEGDFAKGRERMETFLKRYPEHELAVNAMYWIGESFYGEKKYENAILQFQDVIQKHADHPKVAAALLKQGLAFRALGDDKNARVILQQVIERFPKSEEAKKAKEKLAE
jgi:tol-pal system protein YbgF